ncbi:hypothetical protein JCM10207_006775 [Rhodosporidiobolus poonsookiae]
MSNFTYLITGASRGLGLGYTAGLLASSPSIRVVATARTPDSAAELQKLAEDSANEGRLLVKQLDVSSHESIKALAAELETHPFLRDGLDCLVNNAGIAVDREFKTNIVTADDSELPLILETNLYGAIRTTNAFLPLLRRGRGKQVLMVSSTVGSFESFIKSPLMPMYAISKTALNQAMVKYAYLLGEEGFTVLAFSPGYVKTDFVPGGGDLTVQEAVNFAVKNVFQKAGPELNGKFIDYDGKMLAW